MRVSLRARLSIGSSAGGAKQGLRIHQRTQGDERCNGHARPGFFAQQSTGVRVEHPGRDGDDRTVGELDDEAFFGQTTKPPRDVAFVIEEGVMPVTDPH